MTCEAENLGGRASIYDPLPCTPPRCLCAEDAVVSWSVAGKEINEDDEHYVTSSDEGEQVLDIHQPLSSDSAVFTCRLATIMVVKQHLQTL